MYMGGDRRYKRIVRFFATRNVKVTKELCAVNAGIYNKNSKG